MQWRFDSDWAARTKLHRTVLKVKNQAQHNIEIHWDEF